MNLSAIQTAAIPPALSSLHSSGTTCAVVVDCGPSLSAPAWTPTVRPLSFWRRLVEAAGFDVVGEERLVDAPRSTEWSLADHWRGLDPFRGDGAAARWRLALSVAHERAVDLDAVSTMLGLRQHVQVPERLTTPETQLVFLIGAYQEFRLYQPLWAQLSSVRFAVWLRPAATDPGTTRRLAAMQAWLTARNIRWQTIRSVDDVAWAEWTQPDRVLIAGADSTMCLQHQLNAALVVEARRRGWRTVQLQHGVWPYADLREPMAFLSEVVLAWSPEVQNSLETLVTWPDGSRQPRGANTGVRFVTTGCASFDRYADADAPRLADMLGSWTAAYCRSVLVATNLHWPQHTRGDAVNPAILSLAAAHADTLFVLKLHPVHDVDAAFLAQCPANVLVLDEYCCLAADIDCARLVRAVDAVISTLSTVAVEAALARRPLIVLETGNPNQYAHVATTPPERLAEAFQDLKVRPADASFGATYVAPETMGSATACVLSAIAAECGRDGQRLPDAAALRPFAATVSHLGARILTLEQELTGPRTNERYLRELLRQKDAQWRANVTHLPARVAIFGSGAGGRQLLARLKTVPDVAVMMMLDSDPNTWGRTVDGLPVVEPAAGYDRVDFVVPAGVHTQAIGQQVVDAGFGWKLVDASALTAPASLAFAQRPEPDRAAATSRLIRDRATDLARWRDDRNLHADWNARAASAARRIPPGSRVLDLGAGMQALRAVLPDTCVYRPADLVARTEDTVVVDLNRGQRPAGDYDVVTMLGVLEYIHDVPGLLSDLRRLAPRVVATYAADLGAGAAARRKHGWVNSLGFEQLIDVCTRTGWRVEASEKLTSGPEHDVWLLTLATEALAA